MGLINPLQILITPLIILVALPLAFFAGLTTTFAFLVLFQRLALVYLDVGLETIKVLFLGHGQQSSYLQSPSLSRRPSAPVSPSYSIPSTPEEIWASKDRRRRRRSVGSETTTPPPGFDGLALTPSTGLDRDFEGVGGWRLKEGADPMDDMTWESLNSRLEIPDRHHYRSHSGGALLAGPNPYMKVEMKGGAVSPKRSRNRTGVSPNSSRSRTPTRTKVGFTGLGNDSVFALYRAPPQPKNIRA
jgi:hypothetical protein